MERALLRRAERELETLREAYDALSHDIVRYRRYWIAEKSVRIHTESAEMLAEVNRERRRLGFSPISRDVAGLLPECAPGDG